MNFIKEIALAAASAGLLTALLSAYFDWRAHLFNEIRGERSD